MNRYYIKTDYLEHSSGPWKKHKYKSKKKGPKGWIYYYDSQQDARDAGDYNEDGTSDWKDDLIKKNPFDKRGNGGYYSRFDEAIGLRDKERTEIEWNRRQNARRRASNDKSELQADRRDLDESLARADKNDREFNSSGSDKVDVLNKYNKVKSSESSYKYSKRRKKDAERTYNQVLSEYKKTPVGAIDTFLHKKNYR